VIRAARNSSNGHTQQLRDPLTISHKPSFDGANRNPKAQVSRTGGEPPIAAWRRTVAIPIQINQNNPGRKPSRIAVANKIGQKTVLAAGRVYIRQCAADAAEQALKHHLVQHSLDCA
jgi:hypothetical protein